MSTIEAPPTRDAGADLGTRALDLRYDGTRVVHALDLQLPPGRVTAIVGPNGCGKSTLLGALARVHEAEGGAVLLDGRDLATLEPKDAARRIGLLPQTAAAPTG